LSLLVVVGGQYGSEGKGKLVAHLASSARGPVSAVRSGGSNAGHTAIANGRCYKLRQLPSAVVAERCHLYLSAGMLIDLPVLLREIEECRLAPTRLHIDRHAVLIAEVDRHSECQSQLGPRIASTLTGTGAATARKVLRDPNVVMADSVPELKPYLADVAEQLNRRIDRGEDVIVEGSQGFGLSLHHSGYFPFTTSRDTTSAGFLSEVGLSPRLVNEIYVVLRTYPIRVGGNSGPLSREISWEDIQARSGYPAALAEYTTVTGRLRRVAEFDWELARRAVEINRPSAIAIHGADYLNYQNYGKTLWCELSDEARNFVERVEAAFRVPVSFVFTGPTENQIIDRRTTPHPTTSSGRESVTDGITAAA